MDNFDPQEKRKMPEFIVIEDTRQERQQHQSKGPEMTFQTFRKLEGARYPFVLRLLFFGLSIVLTFVALIFIPLLIVSWIMTVVTLFRFQGSLDYNHQLWKRIRKTSALALGFFIATFSPPLGLGIILLYFMLVGEEMNSFLKARFMQQPPFENQ